MPNKIIIKKGVHYHPDKRELRFIFRSGILDHLLGSGRVHRPDSLNSEELKRLIEIAESGSRRYQDLGRGWEAKVTFFERVVVAGRDRYDLFRLKALKLKPFEYEFLKQYLNS